MFFSALSDMTTLRRVASVLFLTLSSASVCALAQDAPWQFAATPAWVQPVEPWSTQSIDDALQRGGIEMRLYDHQQRRIRPHKPAGFIAYEYRLVNRIGVEDYSSVEIDFDPAYQRLYLHELSIKRQDRILDKLDKARISLLHREQALESLIFDGEQTLNLVVPDVRVGDILRVAYTLEGSNSIFDDLFETGVSTERSSSSLARYYYRLETDVDTPVLVRTHGRAIEPQIKNNGIVKQYIVDQVDPPIRQEDNDVHPRFYNRGQVVFSSVKNWADVVNWALPLYQLDEPLPDELREVALDIQQNHVSDSAQIGAAVRWVQDEIRYFGVELGTNSHRPASPIQTLQRRFGDCKGKTVLLISLLHALGIDASPALVDTTDDLSSPDYPWRLHAFNHVIVHLVRNGTSHWLDPTITYQRGELGKFHEPDYGRALIIAPGVTDLRSMDNANSSSTVRTLNSLVFPAQDTQPIEFGVNTIRSGRQAEYYRREAESMTVKELGQKYTKYYRDIFPGLVQVEPPVRTDDENNRFAVQESYHLTSLWESEDDEQYRWLWANDLISWLEEPPLSSERTQPFSQSHPVDIVENWTVSTQRQHVFEDLDFRVETPWFTFEKSHILDIAGTELVVSMRYTSHTDHVMASDLDDYGKRLDEVRDNAAFLVYEQAPAGNSMSEFLMAMSEEPEEMSDFDVIYQHAQFGGMGAGVVLAGVVVVRRRMQLKAD